MGLLWYIISEYGWIPLVMLAVVGLIYRYQRNLLYYPRSEPRLPPSFPWFTEHTIPTPDGCLLEAHWATPPQVCTILAPLLLIHLFHCIRIDFFYLLIGPSITRRRQTAHRGFLLWECREPNPSLHQRGACRGLGGRQRAAGGLPRIREGHRESDSGGSRDRREGGAGLAAGGRPCIRTAPRLGPLV